MSARDLLTMPAAPRPPRTPKRKAREYLAECFQALRATDDRFAGWWNESTPGRDRERRLLCVLASGGLAWMQHQALGKAQASEAQLAQLQTQLGTLKVPPVVTRLERLKQQETIQRQMREVLKGAGVTINC